ncbi:uncharacterized protein LOC112549165 [Alligator sinensis]|uniref:Uncharacterized protein LOC112549165 n=1 Tax=Alligator sinensis TaxID=38654 RepID=A0A3Q0FWD1_ALLSI|nr:uncharacterized protein LOC112549165 [Alligator sinensis]
MIQATISLLLLLVCLCACDTHADILGDLEADVPVPVLPEDNINSMTNSLYVPKSAPYPLDLMHQILETYRQHTEKEESSEKEKKTQILLKGRSTSLQASDKNKEQFEATSMPEPQSVSEKVDIKNPKIYAFFKKNEGIQHKDIKPIPKSIVAACISVPGILVAMIILMHIVSSKYLKNKETKLNPICESADLQISPPEKNQLKIEDQR